MSVAQKKKPTRRRASIFARENRRRRKSATPKTYHGDEIFDFDAVGVASSTKSRRFGSDVKGPEAFSSPPLKKKK